MVITIIECNFGNIFSLKQAFKYWGIKVSITQDKKNILNSDKVVLPGVGAFGDAITEIRNNGLFDTILEFSDKKKPLLGICVGMQLLFDTGNEHGSFKGLGLLKGHVEQIPKKTKEGEKIRLPHIGWESLRKPENIDWNGTLLANIGRNKAVYFAHSFHATSTDSKAVISNIKVGGHNIAAVVQKNHIMGSQFHPEKSGQTGLKIIKNFIDI
tara:strand:+ start:256 stop:891 length:636 start_codon:yes stop_codon:yes gene_type:complete